MQYTWIIPFLFMFTLLAVCIFALVNKKAIEDRRHDPSVPKSTLAKDGPQGGVAFLQPLEEQERKRAQHDKDVDPVLD